MNPKSKNFRLPIKQGNIIVRPEKFAIVKVSNPLPNAHITIQDDWETTQILPESNIRESDVIDFNKGWRWLAFDMDIPLDTIGFFAPITKALADAGIGVDIYSAFSTDHLLIRDADLDKARHVMENLGFSFIQKEK
jgi:hypothetical protein